MSTNTMTAADFQGLMTKAVASLQTKASATDAAKTALSAVAVACVNRLLFDKQTDRLDAACAAFAPYKNDFALFVGKVLTFAGGFREDNGQYLDIRREDGFVPLLKLDAKAGLLRWNLTPKSPAGKATFDAAAKAWKTIKDKAEHLEFQRPKTDKKAKTYADLVKFLKNFQQDSKHWAACDRVAIKSLLDKLSSELA